VAKEMFHAVGRRKSSIARVYLSVGTGKFVVNGREVEEYLKREALAMIVRQPFDATSTLGKYDVKGFAAAARRVRRGRFVSASRARS